MNSEKLKSLYASYGFEEYPVDYSGLLVFTLRSGHFHNADIVVLDKTANVDSTFQKLRELNLACTVRNYSSLDDAEDVLFSGFFSAKETKLRLKKEYEKHVRSIETTLGIENSYKYVEVGYTVDGKKSQKSLLNAILDKFNSSRPTLILIEAAAGFGKTCTAFEVLNELLTINSTKVPLFSELSRNRKAKIFRYVFLDEIDRSFPALSSKLVQNKIRQGRVPVILDGFDELIHQSKSTDDDGYESAEPMLETIGELLEDNSKVLLTTRRTAIFDGDSFNEWVLDNEENFDVVRVRLQEPTLEDWLSSEKLSILKDLKFPISNLNNPVLLAYLRAVSEPSFQAIAEEGEDLVNRYFTTLLEREQERQNLKLSVDEQLMILRAIALDMIVLNYTSESKEYIEMLLADKFVVQLEKARTLYTSQERPSLEELITKLTTHALLDRMGARNSIGFINEFILGSFVADIIINSKDNEWISEERFLEPAVMATVPRNEQRKTELWSQIKFSLEFLPPVEKILLSKAMRNDIEVELENDSLTGEAFRELSFGLRPVKHFLFLNCIFQDCFFYRSGMDRVTFVNCHFYGCEVKGIEADIDADRVSLINNYTDDNQFLTDLGEMSSFEGDSSEATKYSIQEIKKFILIKFWPKGRPKAQKHRPISVFYTSSAFHPAEVSEAIDSLKAENILTVPDKSSFLELNFNQIALVKKMLGKES